MTVGRVKPATYHICNKDVAMPDYRRAAVPGGIYFFSLVTERRQPILTHPDIRQALREAIRGKLQPLALKHQVRIDYGPLFPAVPPFEQAADAELVRVAERLTGHAAQAVAFGTEAPYLQHLGCETLVLGPGDIDCAHQPGEHLALSRIEPTVTLLRQLIQHYCLIRSEDVQRR